MKVVVNSNRMLSNFAPGLVQNDPPGFLGLITYFSSDTMKLTTSSLPTCQRPEPSEKSSKYGGIMDEGLGVAVGGLDVDEGLGVAVGGLDVFVGLEV
jgi:hypothetical protein